MAENSQKRQARQGRAQFKYGGFVANAYFPPTKEQSNVQIGDKYAYFECADKRTEMELRTAWVLYHDEHYDEMQYKVWRPTNFGDFVRDFLANVLKARIISFREHVEEYDPNAVY